MTKKDYIMIASLFKELFETLNTGPQLIAFNDILHDFCEIAKKDNARFCDIKFRAAILESKYD